MTMPDSKREMTVAEVKAARKGYVTAALEYQTTFIDLEDIRAKAAYRYPMPLIEKPREVRIGGVPTHVVDGRLRYHHPSSGWCQWLNAADAAALKDILNNPTERVPADE